MPIRKQDYPPDWAQISLEVRSDAGWRCEWWGAPNKTVISRAGRVVNANQYRKDWVEVIVVYEEALKCYESTEKMSWKRLRFHGLTRIVLTTAHLDRNTANNDRGNLAALCQRCHLKHDVYQHIRNRRYGRDHEKSHQKVLDFG
jgi:hypothetical protein